MLKKRIIPVVLLKNGVIVRSRNFNRHQSTGNYLTQIERYVDWGADEILYINISSDGSHLLEDSPKTIGSTSSKSDLGKGRESFVEIVNSVAEVCKIPLTVGGGIRTIQDVEKYLKLGADKIMINTAAHYNLEFISEVAKKFGSQCVVCGIDVRKEDDIWAVYYESGRVKSASSIEDWVKTVQDFGAGELLLHSIDRDGFSSGYDIELLKFLEPYCNVPAIALGGVGQFDDIYKLHLETNGYDYAAANIFHFTEQSIIKMKKHLNEKGIPIRVV